MDVIGDPSVFKLYSGGMCLLDSLERRYLIVVYSLSEVSGGWVRAFPEASIWPFLL